MTSATSRRFEWALGLVFFIAFIAADFVFGINAAVKVLGVACIVTGIVWIFKRSIAVGVEGRKPSFYMDSWAVRLTGIVIFALGIALLLFSTQAAYILGWASE